MPSTPPRPAASTASGLNEPTTPDMRNRWHQSPTVSPSRPGEASPSSTATIATGSHIFEPSLHSVLQGRPSVNAINVIAPTRKVFIRTDPSLVTCFDPADKELYDLWAPKH